MSRHHVADPGGAFGWGIGLNLVFVLVETVAGLSGDSLALLGDAGHNFGDLLGLLLAYGAWQLGRRAPSPRRTYGFRRASIIASLASSVLLLLAAGVLAAEALPRLWSPAAPQSTLMIAVALLGVAVNSVTAMLFFHGRKDLNLRAAFLHMAADAAVSLGVALAGIAIAFGGWRGLDPLVSLLIVAAIVAGTWGLLREALNLSLDAVPGDIDPVEVEGYLRDLRGVADLHDLHIWPMSTTETALTVHLVMPDRLPGDGLLHQISRELRRRFGIQHSTLQVERRADCESCSLRPQAGAAHSLHTHADGETGGTPPAHPEETP